MKNLFLIILWGYIMKINKKLFLLFSLILSFNFVSSSFAMEQRLVKKTEVSKLEKLFSHDYVSTEEFIHFSVRALAKTLSTKPHFLNAIINDIKSNLDVSDGRAYEEFGAMLCGFYTQLFESFTDNFRPLALYSLNLFNNLLLLEGNKFKITDVMDFQEYLAIITFISFKFLIDDASASETLSIKELLLVDGFNWKSKEREVLNLLKYEVFLSKEKIEEFVNTNF